MKLSIREMAALSGVSVRTLHYYHQIGLLKPGTVSPETGYRWYGESEIQRLRQILFYREMDFSLKEIGELLSTPHDTVQDALSRQRELLVLKQRRLTRLIALLDDNLKGERTMDFTGFDEHELEQAKQAYTAEAKARWGHTEAWAESREKEAARTPGDSSALLEQSNAIFARFAALRQEDPAGAEAQSLVAEWQAFVTANYYACTTEILAGLGQMYTADTRFQKNLDRFGEGTAAFMSRAIASYCRHCKPEST
jgi:DNA-binding transcriptional MerR regulator